MTQAIAYIRISDKDQSNFSIEGQQAYIQKHCNSNNINTIATFIDGRSAKNFDRPNWKKLEDFIKQHHQQVNYLIVVKYDRFSRNAAQGLQKIEWLEKKYRIIIISVFEQMYIDYDSPFFFKQRADMLVNAEFEWHVIRDRTKFGIHQATSTGRYINMAPTGYTNSRDENNKPIIIINEQKAVHIRRIYQQYLAGHTFATIAKDCRTHGMHIYGRTGIPYILSNPVYAGLIKVPAYRKEPAKIVKGLHQPIISAELFYAVQKKLQAKQNPKIQIAEEVPLRAQVAHSHCGQSLTAGKSKGRRQHYWYYKCNYCPKTNYSAIGMHKKFGEVLQNLSFSTSHIQYMISEAEQQLQTELQNNTQQVVQLKKQYTSTLQNLESLEEKYITNAVHKSTYEKFYSKYTAEVATLQAQIKRLSTNQESTWKQYTAGLHRLENVQWLWDSATLLQKHEFLRLVFNSSLQYDGQLYRTPYLLELFHHNLLSLKQKNLLLLTETGFSNVKTMGCAPPTTPIEHTHAFFNLISNIKSA